MNAAALLLCALPLPAGVPEGALPDVRPSDDLFRFPPACVLRQRVRFAERHLAWLDARAAALGPGWAAREYGYREELERRLGLWRLALEAARAEGECRAAYLGDLRRGLGVAAYNRGELPELPDRLYFSRADQGPTVSCGATIEFGDDFGDNVTTFRCRLEAGHPGPHREDGNLGCGRVEMPYTLTWEGSEAEVDAQYGPEGGDGR